MAAAALLLGAALGFQGSWLRTSQRPAARAQPAMGREEEHIVVIGSGIGGLSCACLLARYGLRPGFTECPTYPGRLQPSVGASTFS